MINSLIMIENVLTLLSSICVKIWLMKYNYFLCLIDYAFTQWHNVAILTWWTSNQFPRITMKCPSWNENECLINNWSKCKSKMKCELLIEKNETHFHSKWKKCGNG
jgi:purine-cytosine permease-like protein